MQSEYWLEQHFGSSELLCLVSESERTAGRLLRGGRNVLGMDFWFSHRFEQYGFFNPDMGLDKHYYLTEELGRIIKIGLSPTLGHMVNSNKLLQKESLTFLLEAAALTTV